jgi:hypothetical protein
MVFTVCGSRFDVKGRRPWATPVFALFELAQRLARYEVIVEARTCQTDCLVGDRA